MMFELTYDLSPKYSSTQRREQSIFLKTNRHVSCVYCGCNYKKSPSWTYINDELMPCCMLCHILTNFIPQYSKQIHICTSKLSQIEIITRTVNYIIKNRHIPNILDIDECAKTVKLRPVKFFNNLVDYEHDNYKIFFSEELAIAGILFNCSESGDNKYDSEYSADEYNKNTDTVITTMERLNKWNKHSLLLR